MQTKCSCLAFRPVRDGLIVQFLRQWFKVVPPLKSLCAILLTQCVVTALKVLMFHTEFLNKCMVPFHVLRNQLLTISPIYFKFIGAI